MLSHTLPWLHVICRELGSLSAPVDTVYETLRVFKYPYIRYQWYYQTLEDFNLNSSHHEVRVIATHFRSQHLNLGVRNDRVLEVPMSHEAAVSVWTGAHETPFACTWRKLSEGWWPTGDCSLTANSRCSHKKNDYDAPRIAHQHAHGPSILGSLTRFSNWIDVSWIDKSAECSIMWYSCGQKRTYFINDDVNAETSRPFASTLSAGCDIWPLYFFPSRFPSCSASNSRSTVRHLWWELHLLSSCLWLPPLFIHIARSIIIEYQFCF